MFATEQSLSSHICCCVQSDRHFCLQAWCSDVCLHVSPSNNEEKAHQVHQLVWQRFRRCRGWFGTLNSALIEYSNSETFWNGLLDLWFQSIHADFLNLKRRCSLTFNGESFTIRSGTHKTNCKVDISRGSAWSCSAILLKSHQRRHQKLASASKVRMASNYCWADSLSRSSACISLSELTAA